MKCAFFSLIVDIPLSDVIRWEPRSVLSVFHCFGNGLDLFFLGKTLS